MRTFLLVILFLSAESLFAKPPQILGSTATWGNAYLETVKDIQVSGLHIRLVKLKNNRCIDGTNLVLELDGLINKDTVFIIDKLLSVMTKHCNGAPTVFLNSGGGYIASGIEVGRLFRKYKVTTRITYNQKCQSSCSTAFLGGWYRKMEGDAELMMHSPYFMTGQYSISCASKKEADKLKEYYIEMIGEETGLLLFDRTMSYCSTTSGWQLNKDAADIFGLLTSEWMAIK